VFWIPRIIIELESLDACAYDLRYHSKLQGFVYNLLKGTPYEGVHNRKSYKNFCFSNIDPPFDMVAGDRRYLKIASPDEDMILTFVSSLEKLEVANIGDMSFAIKKVSIRRPKIGRNAQLVTRTPIIIRIPRRKYETYGIAAKHKYVYWRKDLPFNAFIKQLEDNLLKKYKENNGTKIEEDKYLPLFQQFVFKKQVCNHIIIKGEEFRVFGSLWEFHFSYLSKEQRELLQFGYDTGFGERNSLGFGFMEMKPLNQQHIANRQKKLNTKNKKEEASILKLGVEGNP
jgi:CRISPR-associated endoribonuclease Cas6